MNDLLKKFTVGLVGLAMTVSLFPVVAVPVGAQTPTIAELQAQIALLTQQLAALQGAQQPATPAVGIQGIPAGFTFATNLSQGMNHADVVHLKRVLEVEVPALAPIGRTEFFGPRTRAAVVAFQQKHNIGRATGFVGTLTRAKLNEILAAAPAVPGVPGQPITPGVPVVPAGEARAALSALTAPSAALPQSARMVPVLTVDITAGAEALTISEMRFRRTGLGVAGDWTDLHLFEGDVRLTDFGRSISVDTHLAEFPALAINIPAGQTRSYTLRANTGATTGNQAIFELVGVTSNIAITGLVTPIRGNLMSIGGVPVSAVTLRPGLSLTNPMVGAQDVEIASFRVEAGANAIAVEQIAVTVGGTIRRGDVTNLELFHGTTRLATTPALNVRDQAVFVLSPRFNIERNRGEVLTVRADLAGRVTERVQASIARSEDIIAIDQTLGFGATVTNNISVAGNAGDITLQGGRLTLADRGPAAREVALNANDVVLTEVGMTADRNLEVRRITVALPGMPAGVTDLRIQDAVTGATLMGPVAAPAATAQNIDGSFTLTAGVARNIVVTVDTGATAGSFSANVTIPHTHVRDIGTGAWLASGDVVPTTITGKTQTIVATSLTLGLASHPISATVVTGVANVPTMGFTLAAVGTDVTIRSLEARVFVNTTNTFATGAAEVTTPNTVVTLARLMDGATVLSSRVLSNVTDPGHDFGLARFDGLNLRIPRGTTRPLTVQISAASGLDASRFVAVSVLHTGIDAIDLDGRTVTPGTATINALAGAATPRVTTIVTAGTLGAAISAATPIAAIVPVGNTVGRADVPVTTVRYTATNEPIILEEIRVARVGTAPSTAFTAVNIFDGATVIASVPFPADPATTTLFTGLNIEVPTTGHRELVFRASLAGVGQGAATGQTVELDVEVTRARGRDSGTVLTAMGGNITGGNALTIRQTVPTVTAVRGATTLLRSGEMHLMTVTVAADARGDVGLVGFGTIGIAITQGGGVTTTISDFIVRSAGATVADAVSPTAITFTTPETIAANASRVYEIFAVVAGADADADTIVSNLAAAEFTWRDIAGGANIPGTLVLTLPSPSFTLSFR